MESIEQQLIQMLKHLPVPVTMTWASGLYQWEVTGHTGNAPDFVDAVEQALRFVMREYGEVAGRSKSS